MRFFDNKNKINILTGITFCSFLLIVFYYINLVKKLFSIPFSFSLSESLYLWKIIQKDNFFDLYTSLISSIISNNYSIQNILQLGRFSNIFALGLQLSALILIWKKETVKFLASFTAMLIFLSIPLVQVSFYQLGSELWALAIGNIGLYLFMQNIKSLNFIKIIWISFILSLPFLLTHSVSFLAFNISVIFTLFLLNNTQIAFKILIPSLIFCLLGNFFLNKTPQIPFQFSLYNYLQNIELLYAWGLWAGISLLCFIKPTLKVNFKHPVLILFTSSLIICSIETAYKPFNQANWLIIFSAFSWMMALFFHNVLSNPDHKTLTLMSIFSISLGIFIFLFEPIPLKTINENPQLISKTLKWINEEQRNKAKILSQDLSMGIRFHSPEKALQNLEYNDLSSLEKEQITQIILIPQSETMWSKAFISQIKQNYIPVKRIFVFGQESIIFQTKWTNSEQKKQFENNNQKIFATFHRI